MNRHLIWIIAGASVLGVGIPAFAAARSDGTPDDNGVPGEVRGNCDEVEHANDPDCRVVLAADPATTSIVVTVPSTGGGSAVSTTVPSTTPSSTTPSSTTPGSTIVAGTTPSNSVPGSSVPSTSVAGGSVVDVSGPCDEAEHANDPRCTAAGGVDDNSGRGGGDDGAGHDVGDDDSGRSGRDDDRSGRGHGDDDHDGDDDRSGRGGGDDD